MTHLCHASHSPKPAGKGRGMPSIFVRFYDRKTLSGERPEAKKRMFNLANRNLIENKGTLDEQTGTNRRFEPGRSGGTS